MQTTREGLIGGSDGSSACHERAGYADRGGRVFVRLCAVLVLATLLLSCETETQEATVALTGKVIWATALYPDRCDGDLCQATYRVRIANETDTVLYVPACRVLHPPAGGIRQLPIMDLAGLKIRAGGTQTSVASYQLPATPSEIHALTGAALRCSGSADDPQAQ